MVPHLIISPDPGEHNGREGLRILARLIARRILANQLRETTAKTEPEIGNAEPQDIDYLEPKEIADLERAATNLRDRLLIKLLFHLGCRVSEALAITVEDVDPVKGTVTIQHLKVRLQLSCPKCEAALARRHSFCPKCGAKVSDAVARGLEHRRQRVLPIDNDTLAMLKEYIRRGGPVFRNGKRFIFGINRHRAWQIVRECAKKSGLPKLTNPETGRTHYVSPHRLRDAFAVNAVKSTILETASGCCKSTWDMLASTPRLNTGRSPVKSTVIGITDYGRMLLVTMALKPQRGGFLRPFGCGWFIREFLSGNGPYGSPSVDPNIGAPQADIFREYKMALMQATTVERATIVEEKKARREKRPINPNNIDLLAKRYLASMPYKAQGCRFHSFITYFSDLQRLGWVEPTGMVEPSAFQDNYPPGPPRKYFRLTGTGMAASDADWANPHLALYG